MQKEKLESAINESFESELVIASAKSIYTRGFVNGARFALKDSATDITQQTQAVICSGDICDYCVGKELGCAIEPPAPNNGCAKFIGRKLTAC